MDKKKSFQMMFKIALLIKSKEKRHQMLELKDRNALILNLENFG